ncbi:hypothetical protein O3P69_020356 [Scylla paramamosain]|uniref:Uncharacterized protein n=1 Tax=Scylla paramamosain TaxID=85552 RepID=A0AAW0TNQ3_SCYPA
MEHVGGKLGRLTRHETRAATIHWTLRKQNGVLLKRGIKVGTVHEGEDKRYTRVWHKPWGGWGEGEGLPPGCPSSGEVIDKTLRCTCYHRLSGATRRTPPHMIDDDALSMVFPVPAPAVRRGFQVAAWRGVAWLGLAWRVTPSTLQYCLLWLSLEPSDYPRMRFPCDNTGARESQPCLSTFVEGEHLVAGRRRSRGST